MSKAYLVIHMHDIEPGGHEGLFNQALQTKLKDGEIIGTIVQDSLSDNLFDAHIKAIVQDRSDIIPVLVYADYGYELTAAPSDLVFVSAATTELTGNRATSISYTYSERGKKQKYVLD